MTRTHHTLRSHHTIDKETHHTMTSLKKVNWEEIDPAKHFRYAAQPNQGSGHDGKSVSLKVIDPDSGEEVNFVHQAPELYLPFGIAEKKIENKTHYKASFSFPTVRYDTSKNDWTGKEKYVNYYKWIDSIDKYNREHIFKNMQTWFPNSKRLKKEVLDEFYFSNTWIGDKCLSGEYSPTFSTKLMVRKESIVTKFYNDAKKPASYDDISGDLGKGMRVIPLIRTNGLWFAGKNCGMSYQVVQMLFFRKDQFMGCAIDIDAASDCASVPESLGSPKLSIEVDDEEEDNSRKKRKRSNVASNFNMVEN